MAVDCEVRTVDGKARNLLIALAQMVPLAIVLLVTCGLVFRYADDMLADVAILTFMIAGGIVLVVTVVALFISGIGRWREWRE